MKRKRILLLPMLLALVVSGCSSIRVLERVPALLPPPTQQVYPNKPPAIVDDPTEAADLEKYLTETVEKSLEITDLPKDTTSTDHPLTLSIARWIGTRYRYGGKSVKGIDCSGFVNEVFEQLGIDLPRSSREIAKIGNEVCRDSLKYGDVLTFARKKGRIHHVGIYLGDGRFAHAARKGVTISTIDNGYWAKRYFGARRFAIPGIDKAKPPIIPQQIDEGEDPLTENDAPQTAGAH